MKILIGCEKSQKVCYEFRKRGFDAWSCDIEESIGVCPEYHIKDDLLKVIDSEDWRCIIAFPPCTHLASSGARHFKIKKEDGRQKEGIDFFMKIAKCRIKHKVIENPIGIISSVWRKPCQKIQPYYFGDEFKKTTCLWLENMPRLFHVKEVNLFDSVVTHVGEGEFYEWKDGKTGKIKRQPLWYYNALKDKERRAEIRSETFGGIAVAMGEQWGEYLKNLYNN